MHDDSWAQALAILQYLQSQTPYDGSWHIQTRRAGRWVTLLVPPSSAAAAEEVARLAQTSPADAEYLLVPAPEDGAPESPAVRLAFRGVLPPANPEPALSSRAVG